MDLQPQRTSEERAEHEGAQPRAARDPRQRTRRSDREAITEPAIRRVTERSHEPHRLTPRDPTRHSLQDRRRRESGQAGTRQVRDTALADHTVSGTDKHGITASRNRRRHNPTIGNVSGPRPRRVTTHEHDRTTQRDRRRAPRRRHAGHPSRRGSTHRHSRSSDRSSSQRRHDRSEGRESTSSHNKLQTPEEAPRSGQSEKTLKEGPHATQPREPDQTGEPSRPTKENSQSRTSTTHSEPPTQDRAGTHARASDSEEKTGPSTGAHAAEPPHHTTRVTKQPREATTNPKPQRNARGAARERQHPEKRRGDTKRNRPKPQTTTSFSHGQRQTHRKSQGSSFQKIMRALSRSIKSVPIR